MGFREGEIEIVPGEMELCEDAEPRMKISIKNSKIAVVNGTFLVKGEGLLAETFQTIRFYL